MISIRQSIIVVTLSMVVFICIINAWIAHVKTPSYFALRSALEHEDSLLPSSNQSMPYAITSQSTSKSILTTALPVTGLLKNNLIRRFYKLHRSSLATKSQSTIQSKLTSPLPRTGLANNTLIGQFNESLSFPMNWPRACGPDNGEKLTLLIVVISDISKKDPRRVIRRTWGGYASRRGAKLIFLVGKTSNVTDQQDLFIENFSFRDIVQQNLEDVYYNLTLKTVGMMKWVSEHCEKVKFLLKADDDMFVNPDQLLDYVKSDTNSRKTIVGSLWENGQPIRKKGWWYVPKSLYSYPYYPTYVSGGSYLVTGDAITLLYKTSLRVPFFIFEDVLMAGMVAEKAGVERRNHPKFSMDQFEIKKCNFIDIIVSHNYSPENMTILWTEFTRKDIKCTGVP